MDLKQSITLPDAGTVPPLCSVAIHVDSPSHIVGQMSAESDRTTVGGDDLVAQAGWVLASLGATPKPPLARSETCRTSATMYGEWTMFHRCPANGGSFSNPFSWRYRRGSVMLVL